MIYQVILDRLEFQANHGLYDFEKENGNTFYLTVRLEKELSDSYIFSAIEKTMDYEVLYKIASTHMRKPMDLLEQVLQEMAQEIKAVFNDLSLLHLSLAKSNPPLGGHCKQSEVVLIFKK